MCCIAHSWLPQGTILVNSCNSVDKCNCQNNKCFLRWPQRSLFPYRDLVVFTVPAHWSVSISHDLSSSSMHSMWIRMIEKWNLEFSTRNTLVPRFTRIRMCSSPLFLPQASFSMTHNEGWIIYVKHLSSNDTYRDFQLHFWQCPWDVVAMSLECENSMTVSGLVCVKPSKWTISLVLRVNGPWQQSSHLVGPRILVFKANFSARVDNSAHSTWLNTESLINGCV